MKTLLTRWLFTAIMISGLLGLNYAALQQMLRLGADNPQIQMAEDAAAQLASGQRVQSVVPTEQVDISQSLASYLIVFDIHGKPLASSARLDGQIPTLPLGVFDYVQHNGEDRITWSPRPGIREAIVVTQFVGVSTGFVAAGRSLREVEKLIDSIGQLLLIGWVTLLSVALFGVALVFRKSHLVGEAPQMATSMSSREE